MHSEGCGRGQTRHEIAGTASQAGAHLGRVATSKTAAENTVGSRGGRRDGACSMRTELAVAMAMAGKRLPSSLSFSQEKVTCHFLQARSTELVSVLFVLFGHTNDLKATETQGYSNTTRLQHPPPLQHYETNKHTAGMYLRTRSTRSAIKV